MRANRKKLLVCGGFFLVVTIGVLPELHARKWEKRWNDFITFWKAQGEIFEPELLLPAELPPLRRAFLARAKLAASEALQEMVLSENGRLVAVIDPDRIARYEEQIKPMLGLPLSGNAMTHPADKFGTSAQFSMLGLHDALIHRENERFEIREKIASTIP